MGCERKARPKGDCKAAQSNGDQGRDCCHPSWDHSSLNSGAPPTRLCLSPPSLAIPSRLLGSLTSWLWPSITEISKDPFPGPLLSEALLHPGDLIRSSHARPQAADSQACIGPCSPRSSRPTSPNASQALLLGRLKATSNSTCTNLNSRGAPYPAWPHTPPRHSFLPISGQVSQTPGTAP